MLPSYFVIIGALVGTFASVGYLIDTIKGKIKPNRVSFLLWSIAPLIAFAAQVKEGVGLESLMTFSVGFLPLLIFLATFINKKSEWKLSKFDLVCGALSVVGLIIWLVTQVGNIAIFFSIVADALAALPTLAKSYKDPDSEVAWPWIVVSIGIVITLLTIKQLTFENSGFIIYVLIVNAIIYALIQFRIGEKLGHKKTL